MCQDPHFDGYHDEPLCQQVGFFLGMLHGRVLTPDGMLRPDASTLVLLHSKEFRHGYVCGRRDYFTRFEQIAHTDHELLNLLKAHAQGNLYLAREQHTFRFAIGCIVGELSGRLFPISGQLHPHQDYIAHVEHLRTLQEA